MQRHSGANNDPALGGFDSRLRAAFCQADATGRSAAITLGTSRGPSIRPLDAPAPGAGSGLQQRTSAPALPAATRPEPDAAGHLFANAARSRIVDDFGIDDGSDRDTSGLP